MFLYLFFYLFFNDNEINVNIPNFCPPVYICQSLLIHSLSQSLTFSVIEENRVSLFIRFRTELWIKHRFFLRLFRRDWSPYQPLISCLWHTVVHFKRLGSRHIHKEIDISQCVFGFSEIICETGLKPNSDTYIQLQHGQRRTLWSNMKSDYVSLWYTQFLKAVGTDLWLGGGAKFFFFNYTFISKRYDFVH